MTKSTKCRAPKIGKMAVFRTSVVFKIDFTWNLSDRIILKFPLWGAQVCNFRNISKIHLVKTENWTILKMAVSIWSTVHRWVLTISLIHVENLSSFSSILFQLSKIPTTFSNNEFVLCKYCKDEYSDRNLNSPFVIFEKDF